jgi:hypothetical protein
MKMQFHSKKTNMMRKSNNVKRDLSTRQTMKTANNVASNGVFMGGMVERVHNARTGCSACGK